MGIGPKATTEAPRSVLWSKGIAFWADHAGTDDYWQQDTESLQAVSFFERHYTEMRGLVWVRLGSRGGVQSDVASFAEVLDGLTEPIVLLTTDGDTPVPSGLAADVVARIVEHPCVLKWYTQNYDGSALDKLAPFPIGLDLHTRHDDGLGCPEDVVQELRAIRTSAEPTGNRRQSLFCDIHLSMCHPERMHLTNVLRDTGQAVFLTRRLPRIEVWKHYADFAFAFSTHGSGLDCHRTWELLMLGCIVITKASSLDPLFQDLPVAIVDNWKESLEPDRRRRWLEELGTLTARAYIEDRLSPAFWMKRMRSDLLSGC